MLSMHYESDQCCGSYSNLSSDRDLGSLAEFGQFDACSSRMDNRFLQGYTLHV